MTQIEELVERLKGPMPNRAAAVQDMKGVNVIEFDWLKIEAERNEAADALSTLLRERDELATICEEWGVKAEPGNAALATHFNKGLLTSRAESAEAQVERMREALEAVLPYAESAWDEGPGDEGWQSATLQDICTRARAALEPKP